MIKMIALIIKAIISYFREEYYVWLDGLDKEILELLPDINIQNLTSLVIETSIIAIIVYEILYWIVDTKAWTLLKGIIVIMIFSFTSMFLNLNTIMWILSKSALFIGLAIIVIFQPEIKKSTWKIR